MIDKAIHYPVTTAVGVLLATLFGALSLMNIPIQLIPEVVEPTVTVTTAWAGASPGEVEREIINRQEKYLKSLPGLIKMKSSSMDNYGQITMNFQTGTDLDAMFVQVGNKLDQVEFFPPDAERPVITGVDVNASAMAWMILSAKDPETYEGDVSELLSFLENNILPYFERVPGVAQVNQFGGRRDEVHVIADPARMAAMGITYNQLAAALESENRNYSGGDFAEGKRRYVVRTLGAYNSVEDVEAVVITVRNGVPVYVSDVATAELSHEKPGAYVMGGQGTTIAMAAIRQSGANVIDTMENFKEALATVNEELLDPRGLVLNLVYDETSYIISAIDLVQQSLALGGVLAIVVLLLFLRSGRSTLVVAVAIPISVIATFLMMNLFQRTLNVISLAGMAFAVGMVVDNSIVVLENIYRHLQMGKESRVAALDGAREVWGAVLASTLTTIAVFFPIFFVEEEAGQLFRDIAIAISCAVGLSLIVAITVIPSFSARILRSGEGTTQKHLKNLMGVVSMGNWFSKRLTSLVHWVCGGRLRELGVVVLLTGTAVLLSWQLMPKAEYLPTGNQNFIFGVIFPPPGYSLEESRDMGKMFIEDFRHMMVPEIDPELPGGGIEELFFAALPANSFMGVSARDPMRVRELAGPVFSIGGKIPGTFAFAQQMSIFQSSVSGGRVIDVEITGPDLRELIARGQQIFGQSMALIPGAQAQPIPSLDLGNPEIKVRTHRRKAAELGVTNRDLGFAVSALIDGAKATEFRYEGQDIDLKVKSPGNIGHRTHLLDELPVATPSGEVVTLSSLADIQLESGPVQIEHRERQRAIVIQVSPPEDIPLQDAMDTIQTKILDPMTEQGQFGGLYQARLSGTADKLTQTWKALVQNFLLAIIITYLLLSALFESFLYPFVIMFSVPLAALGGFLGLTGINLLFGFQAMDVLTMLGFIILVGTVVNNAILIVHQSLIHLRREGMDVRQAITDATRTRVRPIFMSVSTSVFGMLPLVLFPGAGSELYRGLGSVVVGGLVVSTIFTLFLVPALLSLTLSFRGRFTKATA
ncbi:MAG: efflux RND transporter permease subunit [Acidobacteriota bacterium]|nr:efflux RND transporter permease subunit [Acidobacteriota bacterium]